MRDNTLRKGRTSKQNAVWRSVHSRVIASPLGRRAVGLLALLFSLSSPGGAGGQQIHAGDSAAWPISDAEAGGIVLTAVTTGVSSGHLGARRSATPAVKAFASAMIDDNITLDVQALRRLKELSVKPVEGLASRVLETQAKEGLSNLATLGDGDFDRGYLAHEIVSRRGFLRVLEEDLIPAAGDGEIKLLLLRVRSSVKTQLARAEVVAASVVS